jgi:hypothetical protein
VYVIVFIKNRSPRLVKEHFVHSRFTPRCSFWSDVFLLLLYVATGYTAIFVLGLALLNFYNSVFHTRFEDVKMIREISQRRMHASSLKIIHVCEALAKFLTVKFIYPIWFQFLQKFSVLCMTSWEF